MKLCYACGTHPLHQDELFAAHQSSVDLRRFLPENCDTFLQSALLHLRRNVILQTVVGLRFLRKETTRTVRLESRSFKERLKRTAWIEL